ncbi:MAG: GAF domain-containing protein, partial [Candidatus Latescibacteria bacterium]|nr:GAF domain-containing protein [Candidatus Latescibacterota bacterium]
FHSSALPLFHSIFNTPLKVEERLDLITKEIVAHLHVDSCSIFLLDPRTEYLILRATRGLDPNAVGRMRLAIGEGITGYAATRRLPIAIEDICLDPRSRFFSWTKDDRYRSIA